MAEQPTNHLTPWPLGHRVAFRFIAIFLLLYILPFPLDKVPGFHVIAQWYSKLWHLIVVWVGNHILRLPEPITLFDGGSGDKIYDYVFLFTIAAVAVLCTLFWSFFGRHRRSYPTALHWLRVLVRYYLGSVLVFYGMIKVFHLQMPSPSLYELVQPFGEQTPMGLAWSYVGFSPAFSAFVGLAEAIAGVLLFFRKTTTIGALMAAAVMFNVAVMNFTFYIPVKLYSSMLFLMAVFLVLPDVGRLRDLLLLSKPTQPRPRKQYLNKRWVRNTALVIKILFIATVVVGNAVTCFKRVKISGDQRERSPLYGIYDVTEFIHNGDTLAPLTTDGGRWRQLITDYPNHIHVKFMNDSIAYYPVVWDTTRSRLVVTGSTTKDKSAFQFEKNSDSLRLHGVIGYDSVEIKMKQRDLKSFHLINTRFRWIEEYPNNR